MSDAVTPPASAADRAGLLPRAGARLAALLEWPLSARGLAVLFFLAAAGLVSACWLRPPLSPDLNAFHLPLGLTAAGAPPAEAILFGPRRILLLSPGAVLLTLIAVGAVVVLWRPRRLGAAAGVLLCGAVAANAVAVFNAPALIELLDREQQQRQRLIEVLPSRTEAPPVAGKDDGRIREPSPPDGRVSAAPVRDQEWGGLFRGLVYLLYAPYLAVLAAAGVLLGTRGTLARRLTHLAAWAGAACLLAGAACGRRLWAEHHWRQAKAREASGDYGGAWRELDAAVEASPEFARLQRTWLLAGKLDFREKRVTLPERFFLAHEYLRARDWPRALAAVAELQADTSQDRAAARYLAAQVVTAAALHEYAGGRLAASRDLGRRGAALLPERGLDAHLLLGAVQARMDPTRPDLVEESLGPLLGGTVADLPLRADGLAVAANARFLAGHLREARRRYAESADAFSLPKMPNYRALRGLGGE